MILSLISQKGGVGKSALARLLAVEFAKAGWSVKIADLDAAQAQRPNGRPGGIGPAYCRISRSRNSARSNGLFKRLRATIC